MFKIDRERTLVAVEFEEACRQVWISADAEKSKRVHTALARFDFDDLRAEFGQDRSAIRPGEHVIEADDAHAVQWTVAGRSR